MEHSSALQEEVANLRGKRSPQQLELRKVNLQITEK